MTVQFRYLANRVIMSIFSCMMAGIIHAGSPIWTFTPLTPTTQSVPTNSSATIKYRVSNQSQRSHLLAMSPAQGLVQINRNPGDCGSPFLLPSKGSSCVLSLQALGSQLTDPINDGPIVCQEGSPLQCYQPTAENSIHVTQAPAIPLPSNCIDTGNNNIQCEVTIGGQTNYGFTNMTYALCRSAQCDYQGTSPVQCSCKLISAEQGIYSASVAPSDYITSAPSGNIITSTYSMVDSSGETPTNCSSGPFANCFGASCVVNGSSVTCTCPVEISTYIAPETNCNLGPNLIWSATSVSSFPSIEGTMLYMYDTFFGGNRP